VTWLDERLAASGIRRAGEISQPHLRPWATALRAPTDRGPVWLKASGPETAFEVALYQLLSGWRPSGCWRRSPPIRGGAGWSCPTAGSRWASGWASSTRPEAMVVVLPEYGRLQRDLGPHVDELLRLGLADMRASVMPRRFEEAVEAVGRYVERRGTEADRETLRRVVAMRERFEEWCARLEGAAVGASLDHNDLHYWNVFVDGSVRFYDWGDSVVAHPFASMLLGLGMLRRQLEVGAGDPAVVRPRDAYLEVFGDLASRAELVEEPEPARWARSGGR
jgi:hypothetical protein